MDEQLTPSQIYYRENRDRLLERAKVARKEYYERNKEAIRTKNLEKYYAKKAEAQTEPGRRGRRAGTKFPEGYKKNTIAASGEYNRVDFAGALKSPESSADVIFEETELA